MLTSSNYMFHNFLFCLYGWRPHLPLVRLTYPTTSLAMLVSHPFPSLWPAGYLTAGTLVSEMPNYITIYFKYLLQTGPSFLKVPNCQSGTVVSRISVTVFDIGLTIDIVSNSLFGDL